MREDFQNFASFHNPFKSQLQIHWLVNPRSLQVVSGPVSVISVPVWLKQRSHASKSHSLTESLHDALLPGGRLAPPLTQRLEAAAAVGATSEEIMGKVIIVASPIFLIISRRFILSKGELKFSSSRFSLLRLSSVKKISSSVKLCFRLSSAKDVFPSHALKTMAAVSFRQNALFVIKS